MILIMFFTQDRGPVEHCKLIVVSNDDPNRSCGYHLRLQSTRWNFRAINGCWSHLWQNGGNPCQGNVQVKLNWRHFPCPNPLSEPIRNRGFSNSVRQMSLASPLEHMPS